MRTGGAQPCEFKAFDASFLLACEKQRTTQLQLQTNVHIFFKTKKMATLVTASAEVVHDLRQKLIAADTPLAAKYRALYSLRGVEGSEAHLGLVDGGCRS